MKALPVAPPADDCWNRIGVRGDRSCPELQALVHCHNCPVFAAAGRRFLDAPSPPGYLDEWRERLAAPPEEAAGDLVSALVFRVGEEWLALPIAVVVEVTGLRPLHRVPFRAGLLAGLVNIRGELHLCVRLDQLLGLASADGAPARRRLVVVRREAAGWVFPVDEVDRVHRFPTSDLTDVPATVGRAVARFSRGVFPWQGRAVGYLDDGRLFEALRARIR